VEHEEHLMPEQEYDALARRWALLVVGLNDLIGESDQLGFPIPNAVNYLWNDLRVYMEGLPAQIRETGPRRAGTWTDPPLQRHDEPEGDDDGP
jgi:hypothetical protein